MLQECFLNATFESKIEFYILVIPKHYEHRSNPPGSELGYYT